MNRFYKWMFLILLIAAGIWVRMIHILGDAPVGDISRSGVFYVDEGTYAHNVVNKVIFGNWFLKDDYNAIVNVPIFSLFQYGYLKAFGTNLKSLRYAGIIYISLALILLFLFLKTDIIHALVVVLLGVLNYFFIIYNRLALLENLLILFLILTTIFLYLYFRKDSVFWLLVTIITFWAGFFVKATILFYLPLLILTIIIRPVTKEQKLNHLFIYTAISSFILLFVYFFWISPHEIDWNYFQGRNIHQYINESFLIFLINYARYFTNLKLFQFMPITYLMFLFYLTYLLYELYLKKRLPFQDWFFAGWAICAILFLGFFKYSPPRLSLILIPAIITLTASFLIKLYRGHLQFSDKNIFIIVIPVGILSICQIFFGLYRVIFYHQNFLSCYLPILSVVLLPLLILTAKQKINQKMMATFSLGAIVALNSFQIFKYHHNIQYSYYNAMKDMERLIEKEEADSNIILGDIAPLISIELKTKAVNIIYRSESENQRILNLRPNLLVLQDNKQLDRLNKQLPYYFKKIKLIKTYQIFHNYRNNDDTYFYRIENNLDDEGLWAKK